MSGRADHPHEVIFPAERLLLGEVLLGRGTHRPLLLVFADGGGLLGGALLSARAHGVPLKVPAFCSIQALCALGRRALRDLLRILAGRNRIRLGRRLRRRAHGRLLLVVSTLGRVTL
jgi:hypothetical protein